jgi:hypothetical protein
MHYIYNVHLVGLFEEVYVSNPGRENTYIGTYVGVLFEKKIRNLYSDLHFTIHPSETPTLSFRLSNMLSVLLAHVPHDISL